MLISEQAISARASGLFRLLDLPPELQLAIFHFAVVKPRALRMSVNYHHCVMSHKQKVPSCPWCTSNSFAFPPALARVSRSVRHDALKIFYGQNRFKITMRHIHTCSFGLLAKWLANVETEYRRLVKMRITAHFPMRGNPVFVEHTMAMLRTAGWDSVLGRHRDGRYLWLTFGAPVLRRIVDAHE